MSLPGCFGSPVALHQDCTTCQACPSATACAHASLRFLDARGDGEVVQRERQRIALFLQVRTDPPQNSGEGEGAGCTRRALSVEQTERLRTLPTPVATTVRKLFATGWYEFARRELSNGRNPGRAPWQRIVCRALMGPGITRKDLQLAFQTEMALTPASARVRVTRAVQVFLAGGLLLELDGRLQLRLN